MKRAYFSKVRVAAAVLGVMAVVMTVAPEAAAQRWGGGQRGGDRDAGWGAGVRGGGGNLTVERVIRLADELELTEAQREQLESIRVELLEARTGQTVQRMELLSEIQAGIREPEAMRAQARELAGQTRESLGEMRDRYEEILTEEQRQELRRLDRRTTWRDQGVRSRRGSERFERMRDSRGRGAMDRRGRAAVRWDGAASRWSGATGPWGGSVGPWGGPAGSRGAPASPWGGVAGSWGGAAGPWSGAASPWGGGPVQLDAVAEWLREALGRWQEAMERREGANERGEGRDDQPVGGRGGNPAS